MLTRRAEADEIERAGAARARRLAEIAREAEGWATRRASATGRLADLDRRAAAADAGAGRGPDPAAGARRRAAPSSRRAAEEAEARRRRAADALAAGETELRSRDAAARSDRARGRRGARGPRPGRGAGARRPTPVPRRRPSGSRPRPARPPATCSPSSAPAAEACRRPRRSRPRPTGCAGRATGSARSTCAPRRTRAAIREESETLARERDDLEEAIRKLRHGIANLNREGRGRLLAAFDEVNRNFGALFRSLFGGGEASLVLVESDDPLEAGLEIMCQPPGKKLSTLSLLSGGEQTLTALSLIFAVFLANPSPICVLDEVDAPLDDANVGRFCDLLDEMIERTDTRFLIITHHAVTMARMDRLFGVTMAEQGVSQLVSVDLAAAERIVEPVG